MNIKPLGNRVLLEPQQVREQTTDSGLVIPQDLSGVTAHKNVVVAVGDGVTKVQVGDTVLLTVHAGDVVDAGRRLYKLVEEDYILAVLDAE